MNVHRVSEKKSKLILSELRQISTNFNNFRQKKWPRRQTYVKCTQLPLLLIYVNALPCETQMLQSVTLRGGYLCRIAYLCILNSTEGATCVKNFMVLNISW